MVAKINVDKSLMTYFENFGEGIQMPVVGWYVDADGTDVLIDCGASSEVCDAYWHGGSEDVQSFEDALGKYGKKPEDIDYLIATHLHFDHMGNARKCKNAKVVVQDTELKFAYSPHPLFAGIYPKEIYVDLNFNPVSGEQEIVPGIRVIPAPGHTPGTQSVAVETDKGTAVITGFCCINDNFEVPDEMKPMWPMFTPGIHTNALDAYDSALRAKGIADILIPGHSMEFASMDRIPG